MCSIISQPHSSTDHRMNPSPHRPSKLTQPSNHRNSFRANHLKSDPRSQSYYPNYGIPDYAVGFIPSHQPNYRAFSTRNNFYPPRGYGGYPNVRGSSGIVHDTSNHRHFGSDNTPYFQGAVNGSAVALLGFLYLLNQAQVNICGFNNEYFCFR